MSNGRVALLDRHRRKRVGLITSVAVGAVAAAALTGAGPAQAHDIGRGHDAYFEPGNLLVSRTVYQTSPGVITPGVTVLPPGCTTGCAVATDDASYPGVWNNEAPDPSFGVTSPIYLDQLTTSGHRISTLAVPSSSADGHNAGALVTSFPSKSELGLNLSTNGKYITFMGYVAPTSALDVSNSNTPAVLDPTNPVGTSYYRAVAQVDAQGHFTFTETNAYSGNNGRAAILTNGLYYMVGNSNNGAATPTNVTTATGVEIATPGQAATTVPAEIGNFNITTVINPATGMLYTTADKAGKDNNFR
jgi:hypothetical protein